MNLALILAVLLTLFFLVMLGFSVKTWRWFNVFFMFCVFGAALSFVVYASMSLKTRSIWAKAARDEEAKFRKAEADADLLRVGDPDKADADPLTNVRDANGAVNRILINRGRVWRQCSLTNVNQQAGTLTINTQPPPPAEQVPNRIDAKAVLYLFKEVTLATVHNGEARPVPAVYVGEFQVAQAADAEITVSPTLPLDAQQASHLVSVAQAPEVRWTLYEKMPTDSREAFDGLTEEQVRALLPNIFQVEPARYEAMIQSFLRDNKDPVETDPPARLWVEVEFIADHTEAVDSGTAQVDIDSKYFDEQGKALLQALRGGAAVKFVKQQKAIFPKERADELINQNVCKKVRDVYRRETRDFALHFHEVFVRMAYLADRIQIVQRETAVLKEVEGRIQKEVSYRTEEKAKLEQDLAKVNAELAAIKGYSGELQTAVANTQARASALLKRSLELADQLEAMQKKAAEEIDRRTGATAAATP